MYNVLKLKRDKALKKAFDDFANNSSINLLLVNRDLLIDMLRSLPAPRFYISPFMARIYVHQYYRNGCCNMREHKRNMIKELVAVYEQLLQEQPNLHKYDIWEKVVLHPASSFFVSDRTIQEVVYNYSNRSALTIKK